MPETYKIAIGEHGGFLPNGGPKLGTLKNPNKEVSWEELIQTLCKHKETPTKNEPGTTYIVGGHFSSNHRVKADLVERSLVTMDVDFFESWDDGEAIIRKGYENLAIIAHTTFSHTADTPKWRVVIPLSRPISDWVEYEAVARRLADMIGIEAVDSVSFRPAQLMWRPSCPPGADYVAFYTQGDVADVDAILATYVDWQDFGEYPRRAEDTRVNSMQSRAGNPYEKPGAIGAFNRIFGVTYAIDHFELPYEPENDGSDGRWGLVPRSGTPAARVYDNYGDDCFLYSDHNSDPARGNHNAYDLVRLHLFGELDEGYTGEYAKEPSQDAMREFVANDPLCSEVISLLAVDEGIEDLGPVHRDETANGDSTPAPANPGQRFLEEIQSRSEPYDGAKRSEMITRLSISGFPPHQIDELAGAIKEASASQISKKSILDSIKAAARNTQPADGGANDIELDLLQYCLDDHFGGGLWIKRFGKQFWTYEGGVWIKREDEYIRSCVQSTFIKLRTERPNDSVHLVAAMSELATSAATSSLWAMFCAHVNGRDPSRDPMHLMELQVPAVINCLNGELHFEDDGTWEFTDHHPELFLTAQIPVNWVPGADTTEWDRFCDIIFHDSLEADVMKRHLEEAGGYILQPSRRLASFFMMKGEPLAGKSTFGTVVNTLLGAASANKQLKSYNGANSHDTAGLVGKLLLLDEDFNKGDLLPDGFIKRVSEAKRLTANPKGKDEYEFVCRAVPMVICNSWPATRDYSGALDRRLLAWELSAIPIDMQNNDARDRLLTVGMEGVFRRFVEGFARLHLRGGWKLPAECIDSGLAWARNTDIVKVWFSDCVMCSPGSWVERSDTYGWFCQWYRDNNPGHHPVGKKEFMSRIGASLGPVRKRNGVYGWPDVKYVGTESDF